MPNAMSLQSNSAASDAVSARRALILWSSTLLMGVVVYVAHAAWMASVIVALRGAATYVSFTQYVIPAVTASFGMMLWHWVARRKNSVSFVGAVLACVVTLVASFAIAQICWIEHFLLYEKPTPFLKFISLQPAVLQDVYGAAVVNLIIFGKLLIPLAAVTGLAIAGLTRLGLRLSERDTAFECVPLLGRLSTQALMSLLLFVAALGLFAVAALAELRSGAMP